MIDAGLLRGGVLVGIFLATGCRADGDRAYWWEEGYPFARGASGGMESSGWTAPGARSRGAPGGVTAPGRTPDGNAGRVASELDRTVPAFSVHGEESLAAVIEALRASTGLPLVVDPAAEAAALDAGAIFELELSNPLAARHVLDLILDQAGEELAWTIRHDAILVTTRAKARGRTVLRAHDIRVLTASRTDHVAPRIGRLRTIDDLEDEDGGSPFGSLETSAPAFEEDEVVTLVQENVAPGSWEEDGVSISAENGVLFVVHTAEVQSGVAAFLARLSGS